MIDKKEFLEFEPLFVRIAICLLWLAVGAPWAYAAPTIKSLTPNSGPVGASVTISGNGFGNNAQGSDAVTFNGVNATASNWKQNSITVTVPNGATTGPVIVTVGGTPSNGVTFTVTSGASNPKLSFAYDEVGRLLAAADASGTVGAYTYDAAGNILSISTYPSTSVSVISFAPSNGAVGASVTIYGTGFSATPSQNAVQFNGVTATVASSTATQITTSVPSGATTGPIRVTVGGNTALSAKPFTVGQAPTITSFTPFAVDPLAPVSVTGTNFQTVIGYNQVKFNSYPGQVQSLTSTNLTAQAPGVGSGRISVTTPFGTATSSADLYIAPPPYTAATVSPVGVGSGRIGIGGSANSTIGVGQVGLLLFDGSAGQKVSATLSNGTFPPCSANFKLLSHSAAPMASSSGCVDTRGFVDATTLPETGTYSLQVGSITGGGSATVQTYSVTDLTAAITVGGQKALSNTVPGQNLRFTFSLSQSTKVSVDATFFDGGTYNHCVDIYLLDSSGATIAYYYNFPTWRHCGSWRFIDAITLPPGTYTIVGDPQWEAANIQVTANLYNAADVTGNVMINRRAENFSASIPGKNIAVRFNGSAGQLATVKLTNINNSYYDEPACTDVTLLSTDGTTSLTSTTICQSSNAALTLPQVTLPNTGTYTIYVNPRDAFPISLTAAVTSP